MPGLTNFAIFLFAIAATLRLGAKLKPASEHDPYREKGEQKNASYSKWMRRAAIFFATGAVVTTFASSFTAVSTKNVGIPTSFGAPSGELSDGPHMVWPWQKVTEMDAAIQTDNHVDARGPNKCIDVRIANQQTACVPISIRWRIVPEQADDLFKDYRTFDHVRDSLVTRNMATQLNAVLADYNPLNSVAGAKLPPGVKPNPPLTEVAKLVTKRMQKEIGGQIQVFNTLISIMHFDDETQKRINQLQQQIALTRIAQQAKQTAIAQAAANRELAASVSNSPNVLVSTCLDILDTMVKNRLSVPPGFSCWPGGNLAGVIAGGSK